jgi:hypothetical protein
MKVLPMMRVVKTPPTCSMCGLRFSSVRDLDEHQCANVAVSPHAADDCPLCAPPRRRPIGPKPPVFPRLSTS